MYNSSKVVTCTDCGRPAKIVTCFFCSRIIRFPPLLARSRCPYCRGTGTLIYCESCAPADLKV